MEAERDADDVKHYHIQLRYTES